MKNILIAVFLLTTLPFFSIGQTENSSENVAYAFGVNFASELNYRTLKVGNEYQLSQPWEEYKYAQDSAAFWKWGFSTGANFSVIWNKKSQLQLGLNYSNNGYQTFDKEIINDTMGFFHDYRYKLNYEYLEIPLKFKYYIGQGTVTFNGTAGIIPKILIRATTHKTQTNVTDMYTSQVYDNNARQFNVSYFVGAGLNINFSNNSMLSIEPSISSSLASVDHNSNQKAFLWNSGIGIHYQVRI
jgi:hypothetical protein